MSKNKIKKIRAKASKRPLDEKYTEEEYQEIEESNVEIASIIGGELAVEIAIEEIDKIARKLAEYQKNN